MDQSWGNKAELDPIRALNGKPFRPNGRNGHMSTNHEVVEKNGGVGGTYASWGSPVDGTRVGVGLDRETGGKVITRSCCVLVSAPTGGWIDAIGVAVVHEY